jgi:adenine-specific DNA-methyltransferase
VTATIRYMGSKRSLAPAIASLIRRTHPNAVIADAFSGTCAIASALAPTHRVAANDVHAFAALVGRALLTKTHIPPSVSTAARDLRDCYKGNLQTLQHALGERLSTERATISQVRRHQGRAFRDFTLAEIKMGAPLEIPTLPSLAEYRIAPETQPFSLFTMYFASSYFGIQQAAEIDSLRFAISQAPSERQDFYLLALLQAVSHCGATSGHFAQYLVPRDEKNTGYIARIRCRSIYQRFMQALTNLDLPRTATPELNIVTQSEATQFVRQLDQSVGDARLVIYADPPYSRAQYSRYYHVLETLILYDYPTATGKGRYRNDRFNTDFSRKARVRQAMNTFVAAAAETGADLYLSYPKNGLLYDAGFEVLDVLRTYYREASIATTTTLAHSTLGGAPGTASINVLEDVYHARQE